VLTTLRKANIPTDGVVLYSGGGDGHLVRAARPRARCAWLSAIKPFAFAASALAAFVSPLIFGAMATAHVAGESAARPGAGLRAALTLSAPPSK